MRWRDAIQARSTAAVALPWLLALSAAFAGCPVTPPWQIRAAEDARRAQKVLSGLPGCAEDPDERQGSQCCVSTIDGERACFADASLDKANIYGSIACATSDLGRETCCTEDIDRRLGCWTCPEYQKHAMSTRPVQVRGVRDVEEIAIGQTFACARSRDGLVRCWGGSRMGGKSCTRIAALVPGLRGVEQIAAGEAHACARCSGEVWCWGRNGSYQLAYNREGMGYVPTSHDPVRVAGVAGARAVALGSNVSCALEGSGDVICWGAERGAVGATVPERSLPWESSRVDGLTGATAISVGSDTLCAIVRNGQVTCVGRNDLGQLGDGTRAGGSGFRSVIGVREVVSLPPPGNHRCALESGGRIACWGLNVQGSVDGSTEQHAVERAVLSQLEGAREIAVGGVHTCALLSDHTVKCWGNNLVGQLGDGSTSPRATPVSVVGLDRVAHIFARYFQTCAVRDDGTAWCWGHNPWGQLGVDPGTAGPIAKTIPVPPASSGERPPLQVPE
jgi:alpha-tubulin suppressor-like RCC1 family protein